MPSSELAAPAGAGSNFSPAFVIPYLVNPSIVLISGLSFYREVHEGFIFLMSFLVTSNLWRYLMIGHQLQGV